MSPNHARAARLRERLQERLRRSPSDRVYPVADWQIVERRFAPEHLPALESVFAVANGYLGLRGTPEEGTPVRRKCCTQRTEPGKASTPSRASARSTSACLRSATACTS